MKIVRRLANEDIFKNEEKLYELFLNFPFKDFQRKVQKIDKKLLAFFFLNDLKIKIGKGVAWCFEVFNNRNSLALFVVEPLGKHSEIYGKKMFQISTVINYLNPQSCFDLFWRELKKYIINYNIEYISCRLDASDYQNIAIFTNKDFLYAGISVKVALSLVNFLFLPEYQITGLSVSAANSVDLPRILEISWQHRHNHIIYDAFLDKNKAGQLFSERVREFSIKTAARIYALKRGSEVIGFVSYLEPALFNLAINKKITTVDLIVVDDKCRGNNFGVYLLGESLKREKEIGFKEVELRVASDNYQALSLYTKLGFKVISGDAWLSYEPG
ncbi:MAG: N-acetyltransferase [Patescibacteria group bacterium]